MWFKVEILSKNGNFGHKSRFIWEMERFGKTSKF